MTRRVMLCLLLVPWFFISFAQAATEDLRLVYDDGRYCLVGQPGPETLEGNELVTRVKAVRCLYGPPGIVDRYAIKLINDRTAEIVVQRGSSILDSVGYGPLYQTVTVDYTRATVKKGVIVLESGQDKEESLNGAAIMFYLLALSAGLGLWSIRHFKKIEIYTARVAGIGVIGYFFYPIVKYWNSRMTTAEWVECESILFTASQMILTLVAIFLIYLITMFLYDVATHYLGFIPTERMSVTLCLLLATYIFWIDKGVFGIELKRILPPEYFLPSLVIVYFIGNLISWYLLAPKGCPAYFIDKKYLLVPRRFA